MNIKVTAFAHFVFTGHSLGTGAGRGCAPEKDKAKHWRTHLSQVLRHWGKEGGREGGREQYMQHTHHTHPSHLHNCEDVIRILYVNAVSNTHTHTHTYTHTREAHDTHCSRAFCGTLVSVPTLQLLQVVQTRLERGGGGGANREQRGRNEGEMC